MDGWKEGVACVIMALAWLMLIAMGFTLVAMFWFSFLGIHP